MLEKINLNAQHVFFISYRRFPLGEVVLITDDHYLYLLEFTSSRNLEKKISQIKSEYLVDIREGESVISQMIERELLAYFAGEMQEFKTPVHFQGTHFQKAVWQELQKIPYGTTIAYKTLAQRVGNPKGVRAVANANGRNRLSLIIPCHRVINYDGKLGGYSGGLDKKTWLLEHEQTFMSRL